MSWITKQAGLDKLIKSARESDWETVIDEVEKIVRKFAGADKAAMFRMVVSVAGFDGNPLDESNEDGV